MTNHYWNQFLQEAGWEAGDKYNSNEPLIPIRTINTRLLLIKKGYWSIELVDRIIGIGIYSKRKKNIIPRRR